MYQTIPDSQSIAADYALLFDYAREAATCVDPALIPKRYKHHVPYKTLEPSRHWGRDKWMALEGLPRFLREMINDDPKDPDAALEASVMLWQETIRAAEAAMDRIVRYEQSLNRIAELPEWLRQEDSEEAILIRKLREERLDLQAKQQRLARIERELAEQTLREWNEKQRREYYAPAREVHRYTMSDGVHLQDVGKIIRVPPHIARQMIADKKAKEVSFVRHVYTIPAGKVTVDPKKQAEIDDRTPPAKIHPIQLKRGRNY